MTTEKTQDGTIDLIDQIRWWTSGGGYIHWFQETPKSKRKQRTTIVQAYDTNHAILILDIWKPLIIKINAIKK
jgi:hypothetical protein